MENVEKMDHLGINSWTTTNHFYIVYIKVINFYKAKYYKP